MPILNWLNREDAVTTARQTPYRLLREVEDLGYGDTSSENMIIQGDNLEALKSLLPFYAGQVKCIYIDPPYNTGHAFEHYDDNVEHSTWLSLLYPRLELLREFLTEDGSIWISIDDDECHYLKVICDEIFGRKNFVGNIVWQKAYTANQTARYISDTHDHILCYAKNIDSLFFGKVSRTSDQKKSFKNPDNDPRGPWKAENLSAGKFYSAGQFLIDGPTGRKFSPPKNRYWRCNEEQYKKWLAEGRITFGLNGTGRPMLKKFLNEMKDELTPTTWWSHEEVGSNKLASSELKKLLYDVDSIFSTPKPESLIRRILELSSRPGDLVLDSFLGSGTTAAVAHKMNRRYIGIEMGEHAVNHCVPRLQKVIEGEQGGISKAVGWQGGEGFRFFHLGETVFDETGKINEGICFADLAAHIWFSETYTPINRMAVPTTFLGIHKNTAYALLYNGILRDRRVNGGNVLTSKTLDVIMQDMDRIPYDKLVVYGESNRLGEAKLQDAHIIFKQTPYDIKIR